MWLADVFGAAYLGWDISLPVLRRYWRKDFACPMAIPAS